MLELVLSGGERFYNRRELDAHEYVVEGGILKKKGGDPLRSIEGNERQVDKLEDHHHSHIVPMHGWDNPKSHIIFSLSDDKTLYVGGGFRYFKEHHNSFLGNEGRLLCAGSFKLDPYSKITNVNNQSGHYKPSPGSLWVMLQYLASRGVELRELELSVLAGTETIEHIDAEAFYNAINPKKDREWFKRRCDEKHVGLLKSLEGTKKGSRRGKQSRTGSKRASKKH